MTGALLAALAFMVAPPPSNWVVINHSSEQVVTLVDAGTVRPYAQYKHFWVLTVRPVRRDGVDYVLELRRADCSTEQIGLVTAVAYALGSPRPVASHTNDHVAMSPAIIGSVGASLVETVCQGTAEQGYDATPTELATWTREYLTSGE